MKGVKVLRAIVLSILILCILNTAYEIGYAAGDTPTVTVNLPSTGTPKTDDTLRVVITYYYTESGKTFEGPVGFQEFGYMDLTNTTRKLTFNCSAYEFPTGSTNKGYKYQIVYRHSGEDHTLYSGSLGSSGSSYTLSQYPTCGCNVTVSNITNYTQSVNTDIYWVTSLSDRYKYTITKCSLHTSDTSEPLIEYTVSNESGGESSINNHEMTIGIDNLTYSSKVTVKVTYKGTSSSGSFTYTVNRIRNAPTIRINSYNPANGVMNITVTPNGNRNATIYAEGELVGEVAFRTVDNILQPYTLDIIIVDRVLPKIVKNIVIERDTSDPNKIIVTWVDGGDNDNIIPIRADGLDKSSTITYNIQSTDPTKTRETVIMYNMDRVSDPGVILQTKSDSNRIVLDMDDVSYNTTLCFLSHDDALNGPVETMAVVPHIVVYNPTIVDDSLSMLEETHEYILLKENDIHDVAHITPTLARIEVINGGNGEAVLLDASKLEAGLMPSAVKGLVGYYRSERLPTAADKTITLRYYYTQVREDIPPASGLVTITVRAKNSAPVANDDPREVTDVLEASSNKTLIIPWDLLLKNDYDRENHKDLVISSISGQTYCTVTNSAADRTLTVVPNTNHYGLMSFKYKVSDGEFTSPVWATVTIYVTKTTDPPVASNVTSNISVSDTGKSVALSVVNEGGSPYECTVSNIKVNGSNAVTAHKLSIYVQYQEVDGVETPYVRVDKGSGSTLKAGDVITLTYKVYNAHGSSSATMTINVIAGDDPDDKEGFLYIHRKPIAEFKLQFTKQNGLVIGAVVSSDTETSYDPDHRYSHSESVTVGTGDGQRPKHSYRGIRAWEWGIKLSNGSWNTQVFDVGGVGSNSSNNAATSTTYASADAARTAGLNWINNQLSQYINNVAVGSEDSSVIVSLRVRDIDADNTVGVWSEPYTVLFTPMRKMKPIAYFNFTGDPFEIPMEMTATQLNNLMDLIDLSYDPNGDEIVKWVFDLKDGTGRSLISSTTYTTPSGVGTFESLICDKLISLYQGSDANILSNTYTISLIVHDSSGYVSDKYSSSFNVYKENRKPVFSSSTSILNTIDKTTLYEIDNGLDGFIGDDWGTDGNTAYPGKIDFKKFFTITDDQSLSNIRLDWYFEGNSVETRAKWSEDRRVITSKSFLGLTYSPTFQYPFTTNVTQLGLLPGAYRVLVAATDAPSGAPYKPNAAETTYWSTNGTAAPYHLYVVPKLDIFGSVHFNGWVLTGEYDEAGNWIDKSYRESDGKTAAELGIPLSSIMPTMEDTVEIYVTTNKYVTYLHGYIDVDKDLVEDDTEDMIYMDREGVDTEGNIYWRGEYTLTNIDKLNEITRLNNSCELNLVIKGRTIWGSETGDVMRTKQVYLPTLTLPAKLYDFRVTSVTDPKISNQFLDYVNKLIASGDKLADGKDTDGVLVSHLAVDINSTASDLKLDPIRKGYSFNFSVSSKGLNNDADRVVIRPRLFALEFTDMGKVEIGKELIGCVPNKNGVYEPYTTLTASEDINEMYKLYYEGDKINSLNTHAELKIPTSLRTEEGSSQTWVGRYGIHTDARFFYLDEYNTVGVNSSIEWKGYVLVTFEICAYKEGKDRFNYVQRGQWYEERIFIADYLKEDYIVQEEIWYNSDNYIGAVIVFDVGTSLRDDYISSPVWN